MPRRERVERQHRRPRPASSVDEAKRRHPSCSLRLVPEIDEILKEIDEVLEANVEELGESGRRDTR
jgi:hypothetical protein